MALYKLVELRLLYMRQKIEGPLGKKVEEVGPECADNLVKFVLGSRHVPVDEAAMIHEQVCKSLLEESQQKRVLEAVDMRIIKSTKMEVRRSFVTPSVTKAKHVGMYMPTRCPSTFVL